MIKTAKELAVAAKAVATDHKSLYVLGAFGWPMTAAMKQRAINAQAFNRKAARKKKIQAAGADTFGFDCCGLVKALLWGWSGDESKSYGGAVYGSHGVPDKSANQMIKLCSEVSTDFAVLQVGELLWIDGHVGLYIGDGLAVECTHRWKDGVQITAVHNLGKKSGVNGRSWTKHGKLPYIAYVDSYSIKLEELSNGDEGKQVAALQRLLGVKDSGKFDAQLSDAVKAYQKNNGLRTDGIVGKETMSKLLGVTDDE